MVEGIVAIAIMESGLMGLAINLVSYREGEILRKIRVSPLPLTRFLGGELLAA